jgi:hypothetical protein
MSIYNFDPSESCYHVSHQKIDDLVKEKILNLYQEEYKNLNSDFEVLENQVEMLRISLRNKALEDRNINDTINILEELCDIMSNDEVIGGKFNTAVDILLLAFFWKKAGNKKIWITKCPDECQSDVVTILCKFAYNIYNKSEYKHLYKKINEIATILRWT